MHLFLLRSHLCVECVFRYPLGRFEQLSCTQIRQQWGKLKKDVAEKYSPSPLHQLCHLHKQIPAPSCSDQLANKLLSKFMRGKYSWLLKSVSHAFIVFLTLTMFPVSDTSNLNAVMRGRGQENSPPSSPGQPVITSTPFRKPTVVRKVLHPIQNSQFTSQSVTPEALVFLSNISSRSTLRKYLVNFSFSSLPPAQRDFFNEHIALSKEKAV